MENFLDWLTSGASSWALVPLSAVGVYVTITIFVRIVGLRSFSKMSGTDFVTTVALGSMMAAIITAPSPSLFIGVLSLLSLFAIKYAVALANRYTEIGPALLENDPIYLMQDGTILHRNLDKSKVSLAELHAKLREANVWSYQQVICVVLETTGDVSVLHKSIEDAEVSEAIFQDIGVNA